MASLHLYHMSSDRSAEAPLWQATTRPIISGKGEAEGGGSLSLTQRRIKDPPQLVGWPTKQRLGELSRSLFCLRWCGAFGGKCSKASLTFTQGNSSQGPTTPPPQIPDREATMTDSSAPAVSDEDLFRMPHEAQIAY